MRIKIKIEQLGNRILFIFKLYIMVREPMTNETKTFQEKV
jgi:hypothetical protein